MAITNIKRNDQLQQNGQQTNPYTGLKYVSQPTSQKLGQMQQGYKPAESVTQAQKGMQDVLAAKPQSFTSKYQPALDSILQQIQNPSDFKYSFDGDELFKNYADLYTQQGRQASLDTMGQAAALTGGYGNSYAQGAANQAYQQYLLPLYDKGLELRDRAYQQYRDGIGDQYQQLEALKGMDDSDYSRYLQDVGMWQQDRDYATGRYDTERQLDRSAYDTDLGYWTQLAGQEAQMGADQYYKDRDYAYSIASAILEKGQMPSAEILAAAGLSDDDAKKMLKKQQVYVGKPKDDDDKKTPETPKDSGKREMGKPKSGDLPLSYGIPLWRFLEK